CFDNQLPASLEIVIIHNLMASDLPSSVITKLKAWRVANALSQSQAVRAFADAGLPIKLSTLQQWERGRSSPQSVTAAALDKFLSARQRIPVPPRGPAPVIRLLKAWREANNLSQVEAVDVLCLAACPRNSVHSKIGKAGGAILAPSPRLRCR